MHHLDRSPLDVEMHSPPTPAMRSRMVDVLAAQPRPPQPRLDTLCSSRRVRLPRESSPSADASRYSEPFELLRQRVLSGGGASTYNDGVLTGAMDCRKAAPEAGYMIRVAAPGNADHPSGAWSAELPFDIAGAAEAESAVGKEMLARLMEDTEKSAGAADGATK